MGITYRREIDGLRALAILPVMFFHAGIGLFSGGFVGVDVFFVISGYLITSIILAEQAAGTFSLLRFYERRARRILPALFLVLAACLPMAWLWLLPDDMQAFGQSLMAVCLSASNWLFWQQSGYFDTAAELKPLLHTWSLAVEEQYYLLFPPLLMLTRGWGRKPVTLLLMVLAVVSMFLSQWNLLGDPAASFYLLPSRAGELLIGSLTAFHLGDRERAMPSRLARQIGGVAGLALLAGAVFGFDKHTPFPGTHALLPTLGTALLITLATPDTLVGRLLCQPVLVGLGLISYSAYLWHQPLFAFARHTRLEELAAGTVTALLALTLLLAGLSWRLVERPCRDARRLGRSQLFLLSGSGLLLFLGIGFLAMQGAIGTRWELDNPSLLNPVKAASVVQTHRPCPDFRPRSDDARCQVTGSGQHRVVVWGDSHAEVLSSHLPALDDTEIYSISHHGCPPVVGVRRYDGVGNHLNCHHVDMLGSYADYIRTLSPEVVVLAGRWSMYLNGLHVAGTRQAAHHFLSDTDAAAPTPDTLTARQSLLARQLAATVQRLRQDARVIVVAQTPDLSQNDYKKVARFDVSVPVQQIGAWHHSEDELLATLTGMDRVSVYRTRPLFCDTTLCRSRLHGLLLYADDNHLSPSGVRYLWSDLAKVVGRQLQCPAAKAVRGAEACTTVTP